MTTDPITLAREVLDAVKVMDDAPGLMYLDGPTHECEKAASSILDAAPALARAVLAVAALADELEDQGHRGLDSKALANVTAGMAEVAAADRIRAALNGGDQ